MICKHCGSQLSIEDEKCPFCGQPNLEAKRHIEDMKRYDKEFHKAKGAIASVIEFVRSFLVYIVIIALFAIANIVVMSMKENVYGRVNDVIEKEAKSNISTYQEICQEALQCEDFYTIHEVYQDHNLYTLDEFDDYLAISSIAHDYNSFYSKSMNLFMYDIVALDYTKDELVQLIGNDVFDLYYQLDVLQESNYYTEQAKVNANQVVEKMERFLQTYLKLTKEDILSLPTQSSLQISMMIGRRLRLYE